MTAQVKVEREGGVAVLSLDAPRRRNALDLDMVADIAGALDELEADKSVGALVVTGEPPAFCAGADLSHLGSSQRTGLLKIYEGFLRIARSPLPTIAAVNGAAVGAGMNLALVCDVRLAGRSARFDTRFLQLGIHPGGGHTWMLHNIAGPQTTAAALLFGDVLDGAAAERARLVWRCVDDGDLRKVAVEMAARAADAPPALVQRIKATMAAAPHIPDHGTAVERELVDQVWSIGQPAFAERLAAMQQKVSSPKPD